MPGRRLHIFFYFTHCVIFYIAAQVVPLAQEANATQGKRQSRRLRGEQSLMIAIAPRRRRPSEGSLYVS